MSPTRRLHRTLERSGAEGSGVTARIRWIAGYKGAGERTWYRDSDSGRPLANDLLVPFGGIFGAGRIANRKVDVYTFVVAASVLALWDFLALGNVALIYYEVQSVEDVVRFAETTMPLFSTLVAGAMGYYFGTQHGEEAETVG